MLLGMAPVELLEAPLLEEGAGLPEGVAFMGGLSLSSRLRGPPTAADLAASAAAMTAAEPDLDLSPSADPAELSELDAMLAALRCELRLPMSSDPGADAAEVLLAF